jgi:hypothetical protein
MTFLLIAALNLQIDLGALIQRARHTETKPPVTTCGISTVSYRFVGEPGTEFRYDGDSYRVPVTGSIELIAAKRATTYEASNRIGLPLEVWPRDEFGTRTVPLPRTH